MNDHTDQSLGEQPEVKLPGLAEAAVKNILTLDRLMESARLVEREAVICLRGDLEAEHDALLDEIATLVDEDGHVLAEEDTLASQQQARAQEIQNRLAELREAMRAESYVVRFRAMPADEWAAFEEANREDKGRGAAKNPREYESKLIARCAIAPTITEADVEEKLRKKLSAPQMNRLFAEAYSACTTGGLDVPKSLPFSPSPKQ